jgi:cell wall-associated NlpC family hydrolase
MAALEANDLRVTPVRDGIASRTLEGIVRAEVYLDPKTMVCAAPAAGIHRAPDAASEQMDQLLFGETFEAIEEEGAWIWGQARRDGYVGFVAAAALAALPPEPTHRVAAVRTYAFAEPSIKSWASGPYSMNALVAVEAQDGRLARASGAGWMATDHLAPVGSFETDLAGVAERFLGAPYLWGGRESLGLDCSGLVQQALFACGLACPRDADQQAGLGRPIARDKFGRGDLVFWNGHVAIGLDEPGLVGGRIVHANGFHMMVAIEPLETAISRIEAAGVGQPTTFRRL